MSSCEPDFYAEIGKYYLFIVLVSSHLELVRSPFSDSAHTSALFVIHKMSGLTERKKILWLKPKLLPGEPCIDLLQNCNGKPAGASNEPLNYSFTLILGYTIHNVTRMMTYLDSIVNSEPDTCSVDPEEAVIGKPQELLNVTPAVE